MKQNKNSSIHQYEAPSLFEAYSKLKKDLGENAVILSTKTLKKGGFLGFGAQKVIQITASDSVRNIPRRVTSQLSEKPSIPTKEIKKSYEQVQQNIVKTTPPPPAPTPNSLVTTHQDNGHSLPNFQKELDEIRHMVTEIQQSGRYRHWPDLPAEFQKAFEKLQTFNIHEDISRALIHRWKGHYQNYQRGDKVDIRLLQQYISEMVVPAGPIRLKEDGKVTKVMFVGPTGVGKTTSIAKLAARYKIKENKNVALITVDTYRIAAVEQLRTYSDLIGVPLKVVSSPAEMGAALEFYNDKDLILIDSAGRSPKNETKMKDLLEFVEASQADELHLVLSISVHNDVMKETLERFSDFPVHKLLLTKLDEAAHMGIILSIISKMEKPIGYLTTGQEVPDDIEVATAKRLSRLILNLDKVHG